MPISHHHQYRSDQYDTITPQQVEKIPIVSVRVVMVLALVFGILVSK